ncbi:MAG: transcriptional regulator, MarR family [Microbacteriaceae bacterium]|jgi:DNA-binding MarR family transcriptional regulator|nr:transcriptional regulator, MarR family [Microbacteriaceae bacterium]
MDTEAGSRLRGVIARLSRQLNASAAGEGLTPTEASALSVIAFRGPIGLPELTALEGLNPTMVSRIVGKLDDARLIRRVPNADDLRSANVEITADGREANDRIRTERAKVVSESALLLSEDSQEALARALPALEALADQLQLRRVGH